MVSQTTGTSTEDSTKLLYIIKKATKEVCKYTMEHKALEFLINLGEEKIFEYVLATHGVALRGSSGIFRSGIMKDVKDSIKSIKKDIEKAQEKKGSQSWDEGICPKCGSEELEYCSVCYIKVLEEIQRINQKEE